MPKVFLDSVTDRNPNVRVKLLEVLGGLWR